MSRLINSDDAESCEIATEEKADGRFITFIKKVNCWLSMPCNCRICRQISGYLGLVVIWFVWFVALLSVLMGLVMIYAFVVAIWEIFK